MKKVILSAVLLFSVGFFVSQTAAPAGAAASNAVSNAINEARSSFFRSISDYYSVPQKEVLAVSAQKIPDDEIPVVFYLARQAKVAPSTITALRLKGDSWQVISNRYGYGPEIYYVPVNANVVVGPPYGHAYGYYKNKPKSEWKTIKLEDGDIVNLVNLKFISSHYNYPPGQVMRMRQDSRGFSVIGADIEHQKKANKERAKAAKGDNDKASSANSGKNKSNKKQKSVKKQKKAENNPDHLTGTKKQVAKVKKFYKKKNKKAKKFINDKG